MLYDTDINGFIAMIIAMMAWKLYCHDTHAVCYRYRYHGIIATILILYDTDINGFITTILMLYATDIIGIITMILMLYDTDIMGLLLQYSCYMIQISMALLPWID